jgi:hypothetical protein
MSALVVAGVLAMSSVATADATTGTGGSDVAAAIPCGYSKSGGIHYYHNCLNVEVTVEVVRFGPIPNYFVCVPSDVTFFSGAATITSIVWEVTGC